MWSPCYLSSLYAVEGFAVETWTFYKSICYVPAVDRREISRYFLRSWKHGMKNQIFHIPTGNLNPVQTEASLFRKYLFNTGSASETYWFWCTPGQENQSHVVEISSWSKFLPSNAIVKDDFLVKAPACDLRVQNEFSSRLWCWQELWVHGEVFLGLIFPHRKIFHVTWGWRDFLCIRI